MKRLVDNPGLSEQLLQNTLEYTHFPPAIIALDELLAFTRRTYEATGITAETWEPLLFVEAILITCLLELANYFAPIRDSHPKQSLHDKIARIEALVSELINISSQPSAAAVSQILGFVVLQSKNTTTNSRNTPGMNHGARYRMPDGGMINSSNIDDTVEAQFSSQDNIDSQAIKLALYSDVVQSKSVSYHFLNNSSATDDLLQGALVLPDLLPNFVGEGSEDHGPSAKQRGKMKEVADNAKQIEAGAFFYLLWSICVS